MTDRFPHAELLLDQDLVTEAQEKRLTGMLAELGLRVDARRTLPDRGVAELGWVVLLALPLQGFLSELGAQIVKDVYAAVKSVLRREPRERTAAQPARELLVLHDSASGLRVVLEADLPPEAYQQLFELDMTAYHIGPLHYDLERGRWRSELDEAGE
jgi:hypothetical protein